MNTIRVIVFILFLAGSPCFSQLHSSYGAGSLGCGNDGLLKMLRKDKVFFESERRMNERIRTFYQTQSKKGPDLISKKNGSIHKEELRGQSNGLSGSVIIPIVVHIINEDPSTVTDQQIIDGINELNQAFAHSSPYTADPQGVNTGISFCLAKTAPDGSLTTGIDRIRTYYGSFDVDMEADRLSKLSEWDPGSYCNIWLVQNIRGEIEPSVFKCGKWERLAYGGYASAGMGVVLSSMAGSLLAHEMGHYLSLLHTFAAMDCANNDCSMDGDMVCDTPPDKSRDPSPCNSPENSCNTDTVSGPFSRDVPDMISNFMDYGSPCPSVFTKGQADRMNAFLTLFNGGSLLTSTKCTPPCNDPVSASFDWFSSPYPVPGDVVSFNNTSTGASEYEWSVNGVVVSVSRDFSLPIPSIGTYVVKLTTYNASRSCKSGYTGNVISDCGVVARFSPDKRFVSTSAALGDTVNFTNYSHNGNAFTWFVSDSSGKDLKPVSNERDLHKVFDRPGIYVIKLEATDGSCTSSTEPLTITVEDARPDLAIIFLQTNCYQDDSIRVSFTLQNTGYDSIPQGTEIGFYDRYPVTPTAVNMDPVFVIPTTLLGHCSESYIHTVEAIRHGQDSLTAVIDPNSLLDEKKEDNNEFLDRLFKFKVAIDPGDTTVYVHTDLTLTLRNPSNETLKSILWEPTNNLSCSTCTTPVLNVPDSILMNAVAINSWGCSDTAKAMINVFPKDFTVDGMILYCYRDDSLLVYPKICLGNGYNSLKKNIRLDIYDADPALPAAQLLGSLLVDKNSDFHSGCAEFIKVIPMPFTKEVHVLVNPDRSEYEDDIINNGAFQIYEPFHLVLSPDTYDVRAGDRLSITISEVGDSSLKTLWTPWDGLSCTDCLSNVIRSNSDRKYMIIGSTRYQCLDTVYLNIRSISIAHFAIPNAFTPNGDGLNDYFYVMASPDIARIDKFEIFDRWGKKIFERKDGRANDFTSGWDGSYMGKKVSPGTYAYAITVTLSSGKKETYKGTVTVIL